MYEKVLQKSATKRTSLAGLVHQNDRTGFDIFCDAAEHRGIGAVDAVKTAGAPENEIEPSAGELGLQRAVFDSDGGTKPPGITGSSPAQRVGAAVDLDGGFARRSVPEIPARMGMRVIAH